MDYRYKVWIKNFAALCLSLVFIITLLEIIIRIGFLDAAQIVTIGYKGDPLNQENSYMVVSDDPILLYDFKEKYHAANKISKEGPNTIRVVVLGDSVTRIWIEDEKYYPAMLEGMLNTQQRAEKYEVLNAGVPGYDTVQEVRYLKTKFLPRVSPRLVIVGYCTQNDRVIKRKVVRHKDGLFSSDSVESQPYFLNLPFNFNSIMLKHSSLYRFMNTTVFKTGDKFKLTFIMSHVKYYDLSFKTEEALRELISLSQQHNFDLLVVIFPILRELDRYEYESDWIVAKRKEYNINYIDLRDVYKKTGYEKLKIKPDDTYHPNFLGQRLAAEGIYNYLKENMRL